MSYCGNCGRMDGDIQGKAPLEYFKEFEPDSVCNCSAEQLQAARDLDFYSDKIRWYDAQASRLGSATSPGGIADYESACDDAEMYRRKFDEAWATAKVICSYFEVAESPTSDKGRNDATRHERSAISKNLTAGE